MSYNFNSIVLSSKEIYQEFYFLHVFPKTFLLYTMNEYCSYLQQNKVHICFQFSKHAYTLVQRRNNRLIRHAYFESEASVQNFLPYANMVHPVSCRTLSETTELKAILQQLLSLLKNYMVLQLR